MMFDDGKITSYAIQMIAEYRGKDIFKYKIGEVLDTVVEAIKTSKYIDILQRELLDEMETGDFVEFVQEYQRLGDVAEKICEKHGWD